MPPFRFRFDRPFFFRAGPSTPLRTGFAPRKPRHPLVRAALGLLGLGVLLVLVFFSVFVGVAMLAVGLLYKLMKQRGKPVAHDAHAVDHAIVDGEFRTVSKTALPSA